MNTVTVRHLLIKMALAGRRLLIKVGNTPREAIYPAAVWAKIIIYKHML